METKFCPHCGEPRPISEFYINKGRYDGLSGMCVKHQRIAEQASILKLRKKVIAILGGHCSQCDWDDERALQIDHKNGSGSSERKKIGAGRTFYKKVLNDPSPYQLLCANHNSIKKFEEQEFGTRTHIRKIPGDWFELTETITM